MTLHRALLRTATVFCSLLMGRSLRPLAHPLARLRPDLNLPSATQIL